MAELITEKVWDAKVKMVSMIHQSEKMEAAWEEEEESVAGKVFNQYCLFGLNHITLVENGLPGYENEASTGKALRKEAGGEEGGWKTGTRGWENEENRRIGESRRASSRTNPLKHRSRSPLHDFSIFIPGKKRELHMGTGFILEDLTESGRIYIFLIWEEHEF